MRTREEQIVECAQYLISMRKDCKSTEYDLVECIIHEAEQRVRAEIGRDSERLDNMREKLRIAKNGLLRVKEITGESSRAHQAADRALIQIAARPIDAAREVKE